MLQSCLPIYYHARVCKKKKKKKKKKILRYVGNIKTVERRSKLAGVAVDEVRW
jgi:hypothetical protein